jgi:hypothetical protein
MHSTFERGRAVVILSAFGLCLIAIFPAAAAAQTDTYLCLSVSRGGNPAYLTVDSHDKSVIWEQSTNAGIKCILSWRDGVYGPVYMGGTAGICAMAMEGIGNENYHQVVSISPDKVVAQKFNGNDIDSVILNLKNGRLQASGGAESQCQRAHM